MRTWLACLTCLILVSCAKQDISDVLTQDQDLSLSIPVIYHHTAPVAPFTVRPALNDGGFDNA